MRFLKRPAAVIQRINDEIGKPLCPCMFFEDKQAELERKEWICPCEEMQKFKYCH